MYAYQLSVLSKAEIEVMLINHFSSLCHSVDKKVAWHSCGIRSVHNEQESFLLDFLILCHDFYLMLAKHLDPESKCIAQEIPNLVILFLLDNIKISTSARRAFGLLKERTWWDILVELLAYRLQQKAVERGESGRRGSLVTPDDSLNDTQCSAYGVMLKFCREIVPALANKKLANKQVSAICEEFDAGKYDKKKVDIIEDLLTQLDSRIKASYPVIFLQEKSENTPNVAQQLYDYFLPKMHVVDHARLYTELKLRFNYIRSAKPSKGVLVFISDIMQDRTEWSLVYPQLQAEYDILIFDLPGVGLTHANGKFYSVEEIALHLQQLLQKLKITSPQIIGHGFGGCIAFELYKRCITSGCKLTLLNVPFEPLSTHAVEIYTKLFELRTADLHIAANNSAFLQTYIGFFYVGIEKFLSKLESQAIAPARLSKIDLHYQLEAYITYVKSNKMNTTLRYLDRNDNVLCLHSSENALLSETKCQPEFDIFCMRETLPHVGHGVLDEAPAMVAEKIVQHLSAQNVTCSTIRKTRSEPSLKPSTNVMPGRRSTADF